MSKGIVIDPITRIEGHLSISIDVASHQIVQAHSKGEMFRGFEVILKGRNPLDAQQITQRICGVCPVSHGMASILAQDQAYGIHLPENGRLLRNLILGANYIQSHIIHFYHLAALDFVDIAAIAQYQGQDPALQDLKSWLRAQGKTQALYPAAPFLPRYEGAYLQDTELNLIAIRHYLEALEMRALAQKMGALFSGKMPHVASLVPGGVTEKVTAQNIGAYRSMLHKLRAFIDHHYLPDVVAVAKAFPDYFRIGRGPANFMAYGVFPESNQDDRRLFPSGVLINGQLGDFDPMLITEDPTHAFYQGADELAPTRGETKPWPKKEGAYTWLKAPRYGGQVVEVGPLARMLVAYHRDQPASVRPLIDRLLGELNLTTGDLMSTMGRHAARALECKVVADRCAEWVDALRPGEPSCSAFTIPAKAVGVGITEAPRGALGHWLEIDNGKVDRYQCVVPTTWNCSPRDRRDQPGAVEQALVGTPIADEKNPIEATRVVRSFDPCIACAVH
ncbi:Periplasmic (NiFe) hydrogenase large subunit [Desulfosarcina cetonica]|uniref:nickel-dependent hydrogenase large subunit n=1 Tax=Desulfosarcina cetonica TaxID=90730 RepID=UPI0006D10827|nr:nickel-dependent hydrogenase large subunit [Desulfosarcina cetonica]VTR64450.1 Periplasmic (NiFe) hydrogenase large subunit [Desulfosarcina cetonica]